MRDESLCGWTAVPIAEVAEVVRGVTYKKEDSGASAFDRSVALLRATNIDGRALQFDQPVYVPMGGVSKSQLLCVGDVVIASSSGSRELVGKAGQFWGATDPFTFGAFCTAVRPAVAIDHRYFGYYFQTDQYRTVVADLAAGSNINNLKGSTLAEHVFPVAPRKEQTRIVDKLEELLSDLDAGVAELKAAQKKLAQYRQSLLNAAVTGALTDSGSSYPKVLLGEIVTSMGQGWSPRCEQQPATSNDDWAVIKTTAIQPLSFDGSHNKRLPTALGPREHLELQSGDLLVTRAGPRARVGIACLVRETRRRLLLCDKAYRIKCNTELIEPAFLELILNAPAFVNQIDSLKTGINDGGLNLTQERFFALSIPLPPLKEQRALIRIVELAIRDGDEQHVAVQLALRQSAAQRKNILQAAFSGRLVPQDPNDEPASVLLARIRAERAASDRTRTGTRRTRRTAAAT